MEQPPIPCRVTLEGAGCDVVRVELIVALGSGPTLRLSLPPNHPWDLASGVSVMAMLGRRGEFVWAEQSFSFCFTGLQTATGGGDAVVGIVLSNDVLGWFNARVPAEDWGQKFLVYQRHNRDANAWDFVQRVLGNRFSRPHGAEELERCLPHGVCLLRSGEATNLAHVNRVVELLSSMPTRAQGWCAYDTDGDVEPLRLIGLDAPEMSLDGGWEPSGRTQVSLPHPISHGTGASCLRRGFGRLTPEQAAELLVEVTTAGNVASRSDLLEQPGQAPCSPGPVRIGSIPAFCSEFRYKFALPGASEEPGVELEVDLDFQPLPHSAGLNAQSQTVVGVFAAWEEAPKLDGTLEGWQLSEQPHRLLIGSHFSRAWQVMGDGEEQEKSEGTKQLVCDATTPFAGRGTYSGFYVSYRQGDFLVIELRDGEVPLLRGQLQTLAPDLEGPDLVLNTPNMAFSGLAHTSDLSVADGLAIDGPGGTVQVFARERVALKQKVTITDEQTNADHNASVSGTLNVGSDTTLRKTLTVQEKAELLDALHVAGKAEVEGSFRVQQALDIKV